MEESADLTIEEIKQISVLTRIAMTDNELDLMRTQMSAILDSVAIPVSYTHLTLPTKA